MKESWVQNRMKYPNKFTSKVTTLGLHFPLCQLEMYKNVKVIPVSDHNS